MKTGQKEMTGLGIDTIKRETIFVLSPLLSVLILAVVFGNMFLGNRGF